MAHKKSGRQSLNLSFNMAISLFSFSNYHDVFTMPHLSFDEFYHVYMIKRVIHRISFIIYRLSFMIYHLSCISHKTFLCALKLSAASACKAPCRVSRISCRVSRVACVARSGDSNPCLSVDLKTWRVVQILLIQ